MVRERITSVSPASKKRRKRFIIRLSWFFLGVIFFLIGLSFVSNIDSLLLKEIMVSGNEAVSENEVIDESFLILSKNKRLFIFSGENKFIFSKKNLISGLKESFPRILNAEIDRDGQKLIISIKERERVHTWCKKEDGDVNFSERCYFLDGSGFIFDESPQFSGGVYFTFYTSLEDMENPIGQYAVNVNLLKDIDVFVSAIGDMGFVASSFVDKGDGQYEILINPHKGSLFSPKILFTKDQKIDEIYNKFVSVVEEDPFREDFNNNPMKLEYIDLRFTNRVFYRFFP